MYLFVGKEPEFDKNKSGTMASKCPPSALCRGKKTISHYVRFTNTQLSAGPAPVAATDLPERILRMRTEHENRQNPVLAVLRQCPGLSAAAIGAGPMEGWLVHGRT